MPNYSLAIKTLALAFHVVALSLLMACLCALPASNTGLPFSTHDSIVWGVVIGFGCLIGARATSHDWPHGRELWIWGFAFAIAAYGWVLTLFPSALVDHSSGGIMMLDQDGWTAFGTVDQQTSISAMTTVSAVLMVLLMAVHFGRHRISRAVIAGGVTLSGMIAAIIGLWLHGVDDRLAVWDVSHVPSSVFGLFWYHGNAASFLNLTWPTGIWLFVTLIQSRNATLLKQIGFVAVVVAVLVQIMAVLVNVSKMGHAMLTLEWLLLAGAFLRSQRQHSIFNATISRCGLVGILGLLAMATCAWVSGAADGWARWSVLFGNGFDDPARRHIAALAIRIGSDAKWTGTGPGSFEWISPHYAAQDPVLSGGRWRFAHNDFAQFFAEWGLVGYAIVLVALLIPMMGLLSAIKRILVSDSRVKLSQQRGWGVLVFSITSLCLLLHAVIDFPLQIMATQFQFAVVGGLALAMALPAERSAAAKYSAESKGKRGSARRVTSKPTYFLSER